MKKLLVLFLLIALTPAALAQNFQHVHTYEGVTGQPASYLEVLDRMPHWITQGTRNLMDLTGTLYNGGLMDHEISDLSQGGGKLWLSSEKSGFTITYTKEEGVLDAFSGVSVGYDDSLGLPIRHPLYRGENTWKLFLGADTLLHQVDYRSNGTFRGMKTNRVIEGFCLAEFISKNGSAGKVMAGQKTLYTTPPLLTTYLLKKDGKILAVPFSVYAGLKRVEFFGEIKIAKNMGYYIAASDSNIVAFNFNNQPYFNIDTISTGGRTRSLISEAVMPIHEKVVGIFNCDSSGVAIVLEKTILITKVVNRNFVTSKFFFLGNSVTTATVDSGRIFVAMNNGDIQVYSRDSYVPIDTTTPPPPPVPQPGIESYSVIKSTGNNVFPTYKDTVMVFVADTIHDSLQISDLDSVEIYSDIPHPMLLLNYPKACPGFIVDFDYGDPFTIKVKPKSEFHFDPTKPVFQYPIERWDEVGVTSRDITMRTKAWVDTLEVPESERITTIYFGGNPTNTAESANTSEFNLSQNYPNPFNPQTTIGFNLPKASNVTLVVFNALGQEIMTLVNKQMNTGQHTVKWDGRNNAGEIVPSGIYFYRINAKNFSQTKRMMFMK